MGRVGVVVSAVPRTVRALVGGLIDYAGLFPPASQDLARVARDYGAYRRGRLAWMLGRLVVPAGQLELLADVAKGMLPSGEGAVPWRIAALVGPDVDGDLARVAVFNGSHASSGQAVVDVVEARTSSPDDVSWTAERIDARIRLACEIPLADGFTDLLDRIAMVGAAAKVRTGGVVEAAFPSSAQVAAAIWEAARRGVALKATAGLHHAVRGAYPVTYASDAPLARMHGFVNLLIAATEAWEAAHGGQATEASVLPLLTNILERDSLQDSETADDRLTWCDTRLTEEAIARARQHFLLAIGSCSFEEPADDLMRSRWLSA